MRHTPTYFHCSKCGDDVKLDDAVEVYDDTAGCPSCEKEMGNETPEELRNQAIDHAYAETNK